MTAPTMTRSTTPPATTELIRFLSDGVTSAWAASGDASMAPAAAVTAAGISRALRSALCCERCVDRLIKKEKRGQEVREEEKN